MLYLIDEYKAEFPTRVLTVLNKFTDYEKNLHEMTADEVNAIAAEWKPVSKSTAEDQKSALKSYLVWLTEKGVKVNFTANELVMPVKETEYIVFDSDKIHELWQEVFKALDRQATQTGKNFSTTSYMITYVCGLLSFYGLTMDQIFALDLSDVQPTGIIGYDLPLTEKDIEILLDYKEVNQLDNGKKITGHKYIRSAGIINPDTIGKPLQKISFEEKDKYLKKALLCRNLYKVGIFGRMYQTEKETYRKLRENSKSFPEWFIHGVELIAGREVQPNTRTQYKKEYIAYRTERDAYIPEFSEPEVITPDNPDSEIFEMLDGLLENIEKMKSEILSIKEKLKEKNI